MNEALAMIGGGLKEAVDFLTQQQIYMASIAKSCLWLGGVFLSMTGFAVYCRIV